MSEVSKISRPKIHDYFKRKCTEWNITEFLNESKEEPFQLKIGEAWEQLHTVCIARVEAAQTPRS